MAPSKDFSCGTKENPCPLQGWMKDNASKPASPAEFEAFFKKVAGFAPGAGFEKWATIANEGAAKAKGGDIDGAKAACKTCHTEYKAKYKSDIRDKPVK